MSNLEPLVQQLLSPEGNGMALLVRADDAAISFRHDRRAAGQLQCWVQESSKLGGEGRRKLERLGFQNTGGGYWFLTIERPEAAAVARRCEAIFREVYGVKEAAEPRAELVNDRVAPAQIAGIALTIGAILALTVVSIVYHLEPGWTVFEWMGGMSRPKVAGGAVFATIAVLSLVPIALIGSAVARVRGKQKK